MPQRDLVQVHHASLEAQRIGLQRVRLTCNTDNHVSRHIIARRLVQLRAHATGCLGVAAALDAAAQAIERS